MEIGRRTQMGYGYGQVPTWAVSWTRNWTHWNQSPGSNTKDAADRTPAIATGTSALRHSPRRTNHRSPMPSDGLVSKGIAHSAGQRKPSTKTTAMTRLMFAALISEATGVEKTRGPASGPVRNTRLAVSKTRSKSVKI